MSKVSKVVVLLLIVVMAISFSTVALANSSGLDPGDIENKLDYDDNDQVRSIGGRIISFIQVVGSVVAVAILVVIGIKYMLGSAEEKAEYKKTMLPYIVGAVLIFAATTIASMVFNFAQDVRNSADINTVVVAELKD